MNLLPLSHTTEPHRHLHALEFHHAMGTLVQLTPTNMVGAYQRLYEAQNLTYNTDTTVGGVAEDHRFTECLVRATPEATPEEADHILEVFLILTQACRNFARYPHKTLKLLHQTAESLPKTMRFTYCDEVARMCVRFGYDEAAKEYFEKARSHERSHIQWCENPLGEAEEIASLTEFGRCRFITLKEHDVTYAIKDYFTPRDDFYGALDFVCAVAQGGFSFTWWVLVKLRDLGEAVGLSREETNVLISMRLVETTNGLGNLPDKTLSELRPHLAAGIAKSTVAKEQLIATRPNNFHFNKYVQLMWDSGAWEQLEQVPGRTAWWVHDLIHRFYRSSHSSYYYSNRYNYCDNFAEMVTRTGESLSEYEFELNDYFLTLDIIDALCAVGVRWKTWKGSTINWDTWLSDKYFGWKKKRTDLPNLAAHPQISAIARRSLNPEMPQEHHELLKQYPAVAELAKDFLARWQPQPTFTLSGEAAELLSKIFGESSGYGKYLKYKTNDGYCNDAKEFCMIMRDSNQHTDRTCPRVPPWLEYIGKEQILMNYISSPLFEPETILSIIEFLRETIQVGIFGHGWRYRCAYPAKNHSSSYHDKALVHEETGKILKRDSGFTLENMVPERDRSLSATEFLAQLADLEQAVKRRQASSSGDILADLRPQARRIAECTTLTEPAALYFLAGAPDVLTHNKRRMSAKQSRILGFTAAESYAAKKQLAHFYAYTWLLEDRPTVDTIGDYWEQRFEKPFIQVDADTYMSLIGVADYYVTDLALIGATKVFPNPLRDSMELSEYFAVLLELADQLPGDHPARPIVADKLTHLKATVRNKIATHGKFLDLDPTMPLGSHSYSHRRQAIRALTENYCDELIESLYQPCASNFHDPAASVPRLVEEVCETLHLEHDSARYFLQILALAHPTDTNVQKWNHWDATTITIAAKPLVERGLLVTGKRKPAGRTHFLPGRWLKDTISKGTDVSLEGWKTSMYPRWDWYGCDVIKPVVQGCPPLRPVPKLFEQAWQLYQEAPPMP